MTDWKDRWKKGAKRVAKKVTDPIVKAFTPDPKPRRDPWYSADPYTREINRQARSRPHPHQDLLDAIDDAHRGGPRWIPRRRGWLDR